jgi:hypothetical protein
MKSNKKICYNWYLLGGCIFIVIVVIYIIIISNQPKTFDPMIKDIQKATSQVVSNAISDLANQPANQATNQISNQLSNQQANQSTNQAGNQSTIDNTSNIKTSLQVLTTKQLLEEKCPLSISETRNGTVYINKSNNVTRDDYLFSGCNESKLCDSIIMDSVSKNILDNIPFKGSCGDLNLGEYKWSTNLGKWIDKFSFEPVINKTLSESPERAATPNPISEAIPNPISEAIPNPKQEAIPNPKQEAIPNPKQETTPNPISEAIPNPISEAIPNPKQETPLSPERAPTPNPMLPTSEKTKKELIEELLSKKNEDVNNVKQIIDQLKKYNMKVDILPNNAMVTMDVDNNRIRIFVNKFNIITSISIG